MRYRINYLDAKGLIGSDICNGPLTRAQAIAERAIGNKMADAIEICDDDGNLIIRYPRKLARA